MDFNSDIFDMLRMLSDNAILPLAGLILTVLMTTELMSMLMQKNNMGDIDLMMFVKWGIKLLLGIFFLANSFAIVNGIFNIGTSVINLAVGVGSGGVGSEGVWLVNSALPWVVGVTGGIISLYGLMAMGLSISNDSAADKQKATLSIIGGLTLVACGILIATTGNALTGGGGSTTVGGAGTLNFTSMLDMVAIEDALDAMGFGELMGMFLALILIRFVMRIVSALVYIIIIYRFIEIYMYISLSALPMATFANSEMSSIGKNYVKAICAYVFQGLLIIIVMAIFGTLVTSTIMDAVDATLGTGGGGDPGALNGSMFLLCGFCILLCLAIMKTGAVAKSIFGVT